MSLAALQLLQQIRNSRILWTEAGGVSSCVVQMVMCLLQTFDRLYLAGILMLLKFLMFVLLLHVKFVLIVLLFHLMNNLQHLLPRTLAKNSMPPPLHIFP